MKKIAILLTAITLTTVPSFALEPLILEPLGYSSPAPYGYVGQAANNEINAGTQMPAQVSPNYTANSNMIPQNNAAKGLPVVKKDLDRLIIETKQGTRTNTQWNPGGKGTKSYF